MKNVLVHASSSCGGGVDVGYFLPGTQNTLITMTFIRIDPAQITSPEFSVVRIFVVSDGLRIALYAPAQTGGTGGVGVCWV